MKKKSLNSKLVLNKQTITNLNMSEVKGGIVGMYTTIPTIICGNETVQCDTDDCSVHCIIHKYTEELNC